MLARWCEFLKSFREPRRVSAGDPSLLTDAAVPAVLAKPMKVRVIFLSGETATELVTSEAWAVRDLVRRLREVQPRCTGRFQLLLGERVLDQAESLPSLLPNGEDGLVLQVLMMAGRHFAHTLANTASKGDTLNFKVAVVGAEAVGKSALVNSFAGQQFEEEYTPTVGAKFCCARLLEGGKTQLKMEIWDTAGQKKFRPLLPMYTRGSRAVVLVFDVTRRDSFQSAVEELQSVCECAGPPEAVAIVLVGNKADLVNERQVSRQEAEAFAEAYRLCYVETSAKENGSGDTCFFAAASRVLDIQEA